MSEPADPLMRPGRRPRVRNLTWSFAPENERQAGDAVVRNFLLHWFPNKVSARSASTTYAFWLGTISAFLFLYLVLTGVVLTFLYVPSVERAYASVKDLEYVVSVGGFLRATHRISAHLMVFVVFLHLVRVYLTGAYKNGVGARQHRPMNWWIGLGLLLCTLFLSFTGYLLPWDQLAYWAVTVGTNIAKAVPLIGDDLCYLLLGGHEINQSTLIRFYVLHCFFLPGIVGALFAWHMWRIRKDGGLACTDQLALSQRRESVAPDPRKTYSLLGITAGRNALVETTLVNEERYQVTTVPNYTRRLLLVGLATLLVIGVLAAVLGAPLEEPANPLVTPNPAKAPWYFLWLKELVAITTFRVGDTMVNGALIGGVIIPGVLLLLAILLPFLDRSPPAAVGVWFHPARRRWDIAFLIFLLALAVLTVVGTYLRGPYWNFYWPWESWPALPPRL
jgi:quinol-cytochrome oxidoreductase complex cytochrome b subunit